MTDNASTDIIVTLPDRKGWHNDIKRTIDTNLFLTKNITKPLDAGKMISGSFDTADNKTVIVIDGIITGIM